MRTMRSSAMTIGPRNTFSQQLHAAKYRQKGESFDDYCVRYARTTADNEQHFRDLLYALRTQAILPAGRQQRAVGWPHQTTAFNCFVGDTIHDSMHGIMKSLTEAALTLRSGGGDGWDFSTLRPQGSPINSLGDDAYASGPISFMNMWQAMCSTIRSAGERRGAMMGVLDIRHPDILKFIGAKKDQSSLTNFNISIGTCEEFMEAVESDSLYDLRFPVDGSDSRVIRSIRALDVWAMIMENNWDWAEPGVLFLDTINRMNPLSYCEYIRATNPCGEQPLPPNGACLLLSLNMVKYLVPSYRDKERGGSCYVIDLERFKHDVEVAVRACDNVFERTIYPLEAQKQEALNKRRMGVGITGIANALEICGLSYGSPGYLQWQSHILEILRDTAYRTSIQMAKVKGSFPLFDADKWLASGFGKTLPDDIRHDIRKYGLRNGLLLSIAPTGTISLTADNVSSGIEPPPALEVERKVNLAEGQVIISCNDYALEEYGVRCKTASECSAEDHIKVLCEAQRYVDSSISKTTNIRGAISGDPQPNEMRSPNKRDPSEMTFTDFKELYIMAYKGGAKGCSIFNMNGKRMGIITERKSSNHQTNGHTSSGNGVAVSVARPESCYIDETGSKICG